jgi:hypothetical protein
MTCPEIALRLDDYVDGELAEPEFQEVELHLAGCPSCRDAESDLRRLLAAAAALPRTVTPPRDLWPAVAGRIGPGIPARRRRPSWVLAGLAAAAAVVLAVSATIGRRDGLDPVTTSSPLTTVAHTEPSLAELESEYARATGALLAALDAERGRLAPETVGAVEENLKAIDRALAEIRVAIRNDPGNPQLARILRSTHQRKIDLLRRLVRLSRV